MCVFCFFSLKKKNRWATRISQVNHDDLKYQKHQLNQLIFNSSILMKTLLASLQFVNVWCEQTSLSNRRPFKTLVILSLESVESVCFRISFWPLKSEWTKVFICIKNRSPELFAKNSLLKCWSHKDRSLTVQQLDFWNFEQLNNLIH